jgi:hypothetical protein
MNRSELIWIEMKLNRAIFCPPTVWLIFFIVFSTVLFLTTLFPDFFLYWFHWFFVYHPYTNIDLVVYFDTFKRFIRINACFILSILISSISIIPSKFIQILVTIFAFFISFIIVIDMIHFKFIIQIMQFINN